MSTIGRRRAWRLLLVLGLSLLPACGGPTPTVGPPVAQEDLRLATTSSLQASGLLAVLLADFQQRTHITVQPNAVSAGQAVALAAQGNADALLVDAPAAEQLFVQAGAGLDRRLVLHDDLVLLGPPADPAQAAGKPVGQALHAIAAAGATFVSRRDGSDANVFELRLWQATMGRDVQHEGWYVSTLQDGATTLREANRRHAYTLTDRATYLAMQRDLQLRVLVEQDPALRNPYHIIRVNPQHAPGVDTSGAQALADYLVSPAAQHLIATFGVARYGQPLFVPDAGKPDDGR